MCKFLESPFTSESQLKHPKTKNILSIPVYQSTDYTAVCYYRQMTPLSVYNDIDILRTEQQLVWLESLPQFVTKPETLSLPEYLFTPRIFPDHKTKELTNKYILKNLSGFHCCNKETDKIRCCRNQAICGLFACISFAKLFVTGSAKTKHTV